MTVKNEGSEYGLEDVCECLDDIETKLKDLIDLLKEGLKVRFND